MESPDRRLFLRATEIFSGFHHDEWQRQTSPLSEPSSGLQPFAPPKDEWKLFQSHCEALLKAAGLQASLNTLETFAVQIAAVSNNCFRTGFAAGARESVRKRAGAARAAKRRKADERGRIVRQAILAVCSEQRVAPAASEKFAASIQVDVVEAAKQFGLSDVRAGTSSRSIQRHIAALLKHDCMS